MKNFFLLLIIFVFCSPAFAANWIQISTREYLKIDKVEKENVYYWIKSINDGSFPKEKNQIPAYYMTHYISDCKNNLTQNLAFYTYSKTGKVLYLQENHSAKWKKPIPRSRGEFWHKSACCPVSIK